MGAVVRVVGAGLPRTGTSSLREALGHLLGGRVHHMSEVFAHPEQVPAWVAAVEGRPTDWPALLDGYVGGVDVPFASCWRGLATAFPDAPVLLSRRRDADEWYRSMAATVLPRARQLLAGDPRDPVRPLFEAVFEDLFPGLLPGLDDEAAIRATHDRWVDRVRAGVPPGRLVEWVPGDGWEPLCTALDVPVPDLPFPHENSTADHRSRAGLREGRDRARVEAAGETPNG